MQPNRAVGQEERENVDWRGTGAGMIQEAILHGLPLVKVLVSCRCHCRPVELIQVEASDLRTIKRQTAYVRCASLSELEQSSCNERQLQRRSVRGAN